MVIVAEDEDEVGDEAEEEEEAEEVTDNTATQDESDILRSLTIKNKEFFLSSCFPSRRECEEYAKQCKKINFNDEEEAEAVEEVYTNALKCLDEEDRKVTRGRRHITVTESRNWYPPLWLTPMSKRVSRNPL